MNPKKVYSVKTEIKKVARIEQVMNAQERKLTGLDTLTPGQLRALNAWFDVNTVLAPGNKPGTPNPVIGG
jgi:hypothetical protein